MLRISSTFATVCLALNVLLGTALAQGPRTTSYTQEFEDAKTVVLLAETKPAAANRVVNDRGVVEVTRFVVAEILKGDKYKVGDLIHKPGFAAEAEDAKYWCSEGTRNNPFPVAISPVAIEYVRSLPKLPKGRTERLAFFLEHLKSPSEWVVTEALIELDLASPKELAEIKPKLNRGLIVSRLKEARKLDVNATTVYLRLLAFCGTIDDLPLLEKMLADEATSKSVLGQRVFVTEVVLRGAAGFDRLDQRLDDLNLKNEFKFSKELLNVIGAFHDLCQYTPTVSRERLIRSLTRMLDTPLLAEYAIADLTQLEDWDSMDRLAKLFDAPKFCDDGIVRMMILKYFLACPKPEAKRYLQDLKKLAPALYKRAVEIHEAMEAERAKLSSEK